MFTNELFKIHENVSAVVVGEKDVKENVEDHTSVAQPKEVNLVSQKVIHLLSNGDPDDTEEIILHEHHDDEPDIHDDADGVIPCATINFPAVSFGPWYGK